MFHKQSGAALVVAIFVLVVMAIVGIALINMTTRDQYATVADVMGERAANAARSGAEGLLVDLYPLDAPANTSICPARTAGGPPFLRQQTFSAEGLTQCVTDLYCDQLTLSAPFSGTHFRIIAQGNCSAGEMNYSSEILVEASDGI